MIKDIEVLVLILNYFIRQPVLELNYFLLNIKKQILKYITCL